MRSLSAVFTFLLLCNIAIGQKQNQKNPATNQVSPSNHITPERSGVKRSIGYKFNKLFKESVPGDGIIRHNNGNPAGVTYVFVDNIDILGEDQTSWYSTWDGKTGASGRGRITVADSKGKTVTVFDVTNVFIDGNGYWKIPVKIWSLS